MLQEAVQAPAPLGSGIGELVRGGKFEDALAMLARGECDAMDDEGWIDEDPARSRAPIILICDRQYAGSAEPHPKECELVAALIKAGCPVDAVDDYGCCALGYASGKGRLDLVEALLAAGADVDAKLSDYAPIMQALQGFSAGCDAVALRLLAAGADLDKECEGCHEPRGPLRAEMAGIDGRRRRRAAHALVKAFEDRRALAADVPAAQRSSAAPRM